MANSTSSSITEPKRSVWVGIAASACCVGPLLVVAIAWGIAWLARHQALGVLHPILLGVALVSLFFAGRRIYTPAVACKPGEVCVRPQTKRAHRIIFWIIAATVLAPLALPYFTALLD